jgi:ubiquinone/menaquinone biosynthesis C-methylase UbiE
MLTALLFLTHALAADPPGSFMGRTLAQTMSYHGAPWLTRASRQREERPDLLHAFLQLKPGDTACDIGAGNGFHTLPMAEMVSPGGLALGVDIQPEMLALLKERAAAAGVTNVRGVRNTQASVGLPEGTCDVALMVDVYHELAEPAAMLSSLREALQADGELFIVEYRDEDPGVPIKALHKMSKVQVHKELTANGFKLVRQRDDLPWQHVMAYQRSDGPAEAVAPSMWSR